MLRKDFCLPTEHVSKVMVCIREDFDKVSSSTDVSTQSFKKQKAKYFEEVYFSCVLYILCKRIVYFCSRELGFWMPFFVF